MTAKDHPLLSELVELADSIDMATMAAEDGQRPRRWERLHEVINRVAQVRAENRNVQTFRILQEQCRIVGQRRVEAQMRVAEAQRS